MSRRPLRERRRGARTPAPLLILLALLTGICIGLIVSWSSSAAGSGEAASVLRGVPPEEYAALVARAWSVDGNDLRARERIEAVLPAGASPAQHMADMACRLASSAAAGSPEGQAALWSMRNYYQSSGLRSCADALLPALDEHASILLADTPTATPGATLRPPPSKTPAPATTPEPVPTNTAAPTLTATPLRSFTMTGPAAFCDADRPALLEVYVQDRENRGLPAMELRVSWNGGEDRFFSGLKRERGLGYADFEMETGRRYRVNMPGYAGVSRWFATGACVDEGIRTLRSWRVVFRADS